MNWHCRSTVVTWPKIVDITLPEPVSTIAVSVVGPAALMSACGLSVVVPDLPVVRFTQVTLSGRRCSAAGAEVPSPINTFVLFLPNYSCAVVAILPSHVLQRMGHYPVPPGASDLPGLEVAGVIESGDAQAMAAAGLKVGERV